eukprot:s1205_g9.t1
MMRYAADISTDIRTRSALDAGEIRRKDRNTLGRRSKAAIDPAHEVVVGILESTSTNSKSIACLVGSDRFELVGSRSKPSFIVLVVFRAAPAMQDLSDSPVYATFEEAIANKVEATKSLLSRADMVVAAVRQAEASASRALEVASAAEEQTQTADLLGKSRLVREQIQAALGRQPANATDEVPSALSAPPIPPPPPPVPGPREGRQVALELEEDIRRTAEHVCEMVQIARLAESDTTIEPGARLSSFVSQDEELLQSMLPQKDSMEVENGP